MDLKLEQNLEESGFHLIAGLDEAGRGPLAGPVVAAAVILPADFDCTELNDSKQISASKRELLYTKIVQEALCYKVVSISHKVIDKINILRASKLAMKRCVDKLERTPSFLLIDGMNINYPEISQKAIIKGDSKVASIAAASILAKVTRDRYMLKQAEKYPEYGFAEHFGYPTEKHLKALQKHGTCPIHRLTFAPVLKYLDQAR
ncbi:MAG: ribonuclease HII [Candidatus Gracilibacteria bacterium]|nr:ribonuclease HII [Candidatus Gracilibacteria bacterium]